MSGAQAKATTNGGGICLVTEINEKPLNKRHQQGYLDEKYSDLDQVIKRVKEAKAKKEAVSIGYLGNAVVDVLNLNEINFVCLPRSVNEIREEDFATITHVIDCAFPRNYMDAIVYDLYVSEVINRISQFKVGGQKYLYLGSFSSVNGGYSEYGKRKRKIEDVVTESEFEVLRVGLVLDPTNLGGRALEFQNVLNRLPIVPLPHRSWFPLYVTNLQTSLDAKANTSHTHTIANVTNLQTSLDNKAPFSALGDDPNYASPISTQLTTINNTLALKAKKIMKHYQEQLIWPLLT
jgi:hypothetical protein